KLLGSSLIVDGTLDAQGTAAAPVDFTSYDDDASGGDTDSNGPSSGGPGSWGDLQLNADSTANVLDQVEVLYGGGTGRAIYDKGGPLTLSNSVVSNSAGSGLRLEHTNATLSGDTFTDNGPHNGGVAVSMDLDSNPTITGESAANFTGNATN